MPPLRGSRLACIPAPDPKPLTPDPYSMLTPRGWWLLLFVLFLTALGAALSTERGGMLAILGLALLAWFTVEWARFQVGVRWNLPKLVVEREVRDDRGPVVTLWAGRTFEVIVRVRS